MDRDDWRPSSFDFPGSDPWEELKSANGDRRTNARSSIPGEILAWHANNGTLDDTVREYCGIWRARPVERER